MIKFAAVTVAVVALFAGGPALAPVSAQARAAGSAVPLCEQTLPAATDGHLAVDRTPARPGEPAIGVLSGFQQWPQGLVGGGSGEVFESCTPWGTGDLQVMIHDTSALFLIPVPAGTHAGTYGVSVMFHQGSTTPTDLTQTVRLSASLTVGDTTGPSSVCRLQHATASAGVLHLPDSVHAGDELPVTVTGADTSYLNEYDHLYFVACLAGYATPITYPGTASARSTSTFTVPVPAALAPGAYELRVTGALADTAVPANAVVWWRQTVVVQKQAVAPTQTTAPRPPAQPAQPPLAVTGADAWLTAAAGVALVLAGAGLLYLSARRRTAGRAPARAQVRRTSAP